MLSIGVVGSEETIAGADGCYTNTGWDWGPSCFDFTPTVSGYHMLYLRAWRTYTPGQTSLWMRDVTGGGSWTSISTIMSFGGGVGSTNVSSGRLFVHTQHRPGNNENHRIWSAMINEWQLVRQEYANGRVGQTAMIDVPNVVTANLDGYRQHIVGTPYSTQTGPIRLLQNTWFQSGADNDGDGLGAPLEEALRTCDSVTSPDPSSGFQCADLPGCNSPTSTLCLSSLRDTDHDGLRDDLETWGYDDPLLHIARWGADPARMDVFIELDAHDQTDTAGCQGFEGLAALSDLGGDITGATDFFERLQRIYSDLPSSLEFNPDGSQGIRLHLDVGVDNPDPTDHRWGNWGGGNSCVETDCDYVKAYFNNCASPTYSDERKWVFFYGVDANPDQGGGAASGRRIAFSARDASHYAHEIGHLGHLNHGGPQGSAGALSHFGNFRPQYPSRINYAYQNVGGSTAVGAEWHSVTFSAGDLNLPLSNVGAQESCPFPGQDLADLGLDDNSGYAPREMVEWNASTACWDVDWNRDGVISGTTYLKRMSERRWNDRWSSLDGNAITPQPAAWSLASVGDVMLFGYIERTPTGDEVVLRADSDADCELYPLDIRGTALPLNDPDFVTGGAYPGCVRPGRSAVQPGLSATAAALTSGRAYLGGALSEAGILVRNDSGTSRWEVLDVAPSTGPTEMTLTATSMGTIGTGIAVCEGCAEPALVRTPGTDTTVLAYRDASGLLWERTLAPGASIWSAPQAMMSGAAQITSNTAVSLAARGANIWMASTDAAGVVLIHERVGASWVQRANLGTSSNTRLRPSIAIADDFEQPTSKRMWVYFLQPTADYEEVVVLRWSNLDDFTIYGPIKQVVHKQRGATAPTAFWDGRPLLGSSPELRLVRGVVSSAWACTSSADCPAPAATCDTAINRCRDAGGARVALTRYTPFARGPAAGVYTDYNDWLALRVGFCRSLDDKSSWAPDFTDGYVPTSFRTSQDCGPFPTYSEPLAGGGMAVVAASPPNDEVLRPWLYEDQGEVICEEESP